MLLQDKVALVTGGARRVGRAIALELARAGADVAVHYCTSAEQARRTVAEIRRIGRRAAAFEADFAHVGQATPLVEAVIAELGRLDILVNNAAVFEPDDADSLDAHQCLRQININLVVPMLLCAACSAELRRSGAGRIVNICDARIDRPMAGYLTYTVAKVGLVGLTRALARSMAPAVQVNAVSPGVVRFPDEGEVTTTGGALGGVPAGRPGRPEDVARVVRFLAAEADYVTGQVWTVDGGRTLA